MLGAALACGLSGVTWRYGLVLLLPGALLIASARRPAPRGGGA
jgi:hypothetical protein